MVQGLAAAAGLGAVIVHVEPLFVAVKWLGIAYLPSFLYAEAMKKKQVEEAIPGLPVELQGIYAVYPPGRFTQPKVRAFIDFLVEAFAEKGPDNW